MSANIYYHQVKPATNKELPTWAPSSFMETMDQVFGEKLPTLGEKDIIKLEVLSATFSGDSYAPNPYKELIRAINKYGDIKLTAEY